MSVILVYSWLCGVALDNSQCIIIPIEISENRALVSTMNNNAIPNVKEAPENSDFRTTCVKKQE